MAGPGAENPLAGLGQWWQRRRSARAKGTLLYLLSVPLLMATIGALATGDLGASLANAGGFALLLGAAQATRSGTGSEERGAPW